MDGLQRKRILAIVVVIILIGAGISVYWYLTAPKSIQTIYQNYDNNKGTFPSYKPGDNVPVAGKITAIDIINTTSGPIKVVRLDGAPLSEGIIVDPNSEYRVGDQYTTILHFKEFRYNDDRFVAAEELFGPIPVAPLELSNTLDKVSVAGTSLVLVPMTTGGNIEFTVFWTVLEPHGGYPLELFNLTLRKGKHYMAQDIIDLSGEGTTVEGSDATSDPTDYPIIDSIENLSNATSEGILDFQDAGNIGRLDGGDRIIIHVPFPANSDQYESYFLELGSRDMFVISQYIVVSKDGILKYITEPSNFQMMVKSDEPSPGGRRLDIEVSCAVGQSFSPYGAFRWGVVNKDGIETTGMLIPSTPVKEGPGEPSMEYLDVNGNGLLDPPDELVIDGLENLELYHLNLNIGSSWEYHLAWISGLGMDTCYNSYIQLECNRTDPGTFQINISRMYGKAGIILEGMSAVLTENGTEMANATIENGIFSGTGNATLNFTDVDANGYLNEGDHFTVQCMPNANYTLDLKHIPARARIAWMS